MFLLDCDPDNYSLPFLCPAVTQAEDPEKLLDTVVTEMQEDLIKMRQAAAQVRGGEGGVGQGEKMRRCVWLPLWNWCLNR